MLDPEEDKKELERDCFASTLGLYELCCRFYVDLSSLVCGRLLNLPNRLLGLLGKPVRRWY